MTPLLDAIAAAGAVTIAAGAATAMSIPPRSRAWGNVISNGRATGIDIALTFDDGPTAGATDRLLDELDRLQVPATFFAIGCNVVQNPDILRSVADRGHIVGNHSFDHSHFGYFWSKRYWIDQIGRTDAAIVQAIGKRPALFRPPLGVKSPMIHAAARRAGQTIVTWSKRGMDGVETTSEAICTRFGSNVVGGDILLLHDGIEPHQPRDPGPTIEAMGPIVSDLRARGLRFVRLDQLLGIEAYQENLRPTEPSGSAAGSSA